jgi:RNA ligase
LTEITFTPWPKIPRLFKDPMVITEKIDGTNGAVGVVQLEPGGHWDAGQANQIVWSGDGETAYAVYAQSRNRITTPDRGGGGGSDNYAFAEWVWANGSELVRVLGVGLHYGEWWGRGIGRGYGLTERRFSLFNTSRWRHLADPEARAAIKPPEPLTVVPTLWTGTPDTIRVHFHLGLLKAMGSEAAPGYMNPEGICVFLPSGKQIYKVTFEGDQPKGSIQEWQMTRKNAELVA